jgi:small subunit ribosomal protein S6
MQKYELLLILPGTLDEKQAETRSQEIVTMVKEHGDKPMITVIGKNRLAYPIKQIRYGYFYTITFEAEAKPLKALETKLSLLRDVLRAIITHFNIELSATQRIAYTTENLTSAPMVDKTATAPMEREGVFAPTPAPVQKVAEPMPVAKKATKTDPLAMEEITKKLDEILSGDNIIPGV